jgi:hypothetical protein
MDSHSIATQVLTGSRVQQLTSSQVEETALGLPRFPIEDLMETI